MTYEKSSFTESGIPATKDIVIAFERVINASLPDDYRQFLLEVNGGQPKQNLFPIAENPNDTAGIVDFFFSIDGDDSDYDLAENFTIYRTRIPSTLLPIACDPGGNLVCLVINGNDAGKIFFWDHNDEFISEGILLPHNIYFVASSFNELIVNLF